MFRCFPLVVATARCTPRTTQAPWLSVYVLKRPVFEPPPSIAPSWRPESASDGGHLLGAYESVRSVPSHAVLAVALSWLGRDDAHARYTDVAFREPGRWSQGPDGGGRCARRAVTRLRRQAHGARLLGWRGRLLRDAFQACRPVAAVVSRVSRHARARRPEARGDGGPDARHAAAVRRRHQGGHLHGRARRLVAEAGQPPAQGSADDDALAGAAHHRRAPSAGRRRRRSHRAREGLRQAAAASAGVCSATQRYPNPNPNPNPYRR